MFDESTITELKQPLLREHVAERKGAGNFKLSYIEGWHAIMEANRIFGFDGWTRETVDMVRTGERQYTKKGRGTDPDKQMFAVGYTARVRISVPVLNAVVVREGTGFGSGQAANLEDAYESAIKEAETDAMKRALITFGNQFGLALYDKTQAHVVNDRAGASEARKEGLYEDLVEELRQLAQKGNPDLLDAWWKSSDTQAKGAKLPKGWVDNLKKEFKSCKQTAEQLNQGDFPGDV